MGLIAKKRGAHKRVKGGTTGGTDSCFARKRGAAECGGQKERNDSTKTAVFSTTMVPSTTNSIELSDSSSQSSYSESTLSSVSSLESDASSDNSRYGSLLALSDRVCGVFHNQIAVLNNLVLAGFGVRPIYPATPIVLGDASSSSTESTCSCNCNHVYAQPRVEEKNQTENHDHV